MSMTGSFLSVSPQQLEQITADPDEIESLLGKRVGSRFSSKKCSDYCDIDKSWQTIHFLLSQGDPWEVTNTESLAVLSIGPFHIFRRHHGRPTRFCLSLVFM